MDRTGARGETGSAVCVAHRSYALGSVRRGPAIPAVRLGLFATRGSDIRTGLPASDRPALRVRHRDVLPSLAVYAVRTNERRLALVQVIALADDTVTL